jgi:hypothetical protein
MCDKSHLDTSMNRLIIKIYYFFKSLGCQHAFFIQKESSGFIVYQCSECLDTIGIQK